MDIRAFYRLNTSVITSVTNKKYASIIRVGLVAKKVGEYDYEYILEYVLEYCETTSNFRKHIIAKFKTLFSFD